MDPCLPGMHGGCGIFGSKAGWHKAAVTISPSQLLCQKRGFCKLEALIGVRLRRVLLIRIHAFGIRYFPKRPGLKPSLPWRCFQFVLDWRQTFLDSVKPQYLPAGWDLHRSIRKHVPRRNCICTRYCTHPDSWGQCKREGKQQVSARTRET